MEGGGRRGGGGSRGVTIPCSKPARSSAHGAPVHTHKDGGGTGVRGQPVVNPVRVTAAVVPFTPSWARTFLLCAEHTVARRGTLPRRGEGAAGQAPLFRPYFHR